MIAGVPCETAPGERRVALTPESAAAIVDHGTVVAIESGAGAAAGYGDDEFRQRSVEIVSDRKTLFERADIIIQVRTAAANTERGDADVALLGPKHVVIGLADPLDGRPQLQKIAGTGAALFAMELMPRITRAQGMDALSSMATIAGYKAVIQSAMALPRMFPLLMTAAGTVAPARVLVIGAGVAGLQAIATAKRLGGIVLAYDVRPAVKEQVESLSAQFVDLGLDTADSEDAGGYAKAQDVDFYDRQQQALAEVVADCDVVVSTAAIPGRAAPILITADAVKGMKPGSVIFDLAAERGGNCALSKPGETVDVDGVSIQAMLNVPSTVPYHASQMYGQNMSAFLRHLLRNDGQLQLDEDDEITAETLIAKGGKIVNCRVAEVIGQRGDTSRKH